MDTISSSAKLSIQQIRDVNLAWVRTDLGDLTGLRHSIKKEGLQLPVLMTTTMLVADGARRLVACEQLGWTQIPVLITSDWDLVKRYYAVAHRLERDGWPTKALPWSDIADLLNGPMKALYAERYRTLRRAVWDRNSRLRERGATVETEKKSLYNEAAAEVLGFRTTSVIRTIRELYGTLAKMQAPAEKGESPDQVEFRHTWAKKLTEQLAECEESGGDRLYGVAARIRKANKGEDPSTIKYARSRLSTQEERAAAAETGSAPVGRELSKPVLINLNEMLAQLAETGHFYTHVRPNVPKEEAAEIADAMKAAVRKISSLVKVVRDYASEPNLEERAS